MLNHEYYGLDLNLYGMSTIFFFFSFSVSFGFFFFLLFSGFVSKNPYVLLANPSGSSTGSAISAATNLATVTLGIETDGSIITPSSANSVVGIKPTLGLTSRAGVILISPRQDNVGDKKATIAASKFIPAGGYKQFLKAEGLRGKRLGILRRPFFNFSGTSVSAQTFETHFKTLRQKGTILVYNIEISNINVILDVRESGEGLALLYEFKKALNAYLSELLVSPVRTLGDVIAFNLKHSKEVSLALSPIPFPFSTLIIELDAVLSSFNLF
ncbi:hypothetical protein AMTR_s00041p00213600 [Amborella trichopoda]|uniref:Amidase domain-containing protein n=1 Tax=Amborella trichopoda TaxID=13333 RepID=W1PYR2_AMBTC|nr:hypothetical protein AMTR_s00041p00213600 [Amborella trichopoda]